MYVCFSALRCSHLVCCSVCAVQRVMKPVYLPVALLQRSDVRRWWRRLAYGCDSAAATFRRPCFDATTAPRRGTCCAAARAGSDTLATAPPPHPSPAPPGAVSSSRTVTVGFDMLKSSPGRPIIPGTILAYAPPKQLRRPCTDVILVLSALEQKH